MQKKLLKLQEIIFQIRLISIEVLPLKVTTGKIIDSPISANQIPTGHLVPSALEAEASTEAAEEEASVEAAEEEASGEEIAAAFPLGTPHLELTLIWLES